MIGSTIFVRISSQLKLVHPVVFCRLELNRFTQTNDEISHVLTKLLSVMETMMNAETPEFEITNDTTSLK